MIIKQIAAEIAARPDQVNAAVQLLDEGATVPFIARYRKEVTGGLDDTQLRNLSERLTYLRELGTRRKAIFDSITSQNKMTDELKWVKFSGAAWKNDGFYYSRYDEPAKGKELSGKNEFHKVYYHKLGTPQSADKLVYSDAKFPLRYYGAETTEDEKFLIISVSQGTDGTELYCQDLSKGQKDFRVGKKY